MFDGSLLVRPREAGVVSSEDMSDQGYEALAADDPLLRLTADAARNEMNERVAAVNTAEPVTTAPVETFDYIPLTKAAYLSRKKMYETLQELYDRAKTTGQSIYERQQRCILCSFMHRGVDASFIGTRLFDELNRIVEERYLRSNTIDLVTLAHRFYTEQIVPVFSEANPPIQIPVFDQVAIFEHLTTLYHSLHASIFVATRIRLLEDQIQILNDHSTAEGERDNIKSMEQVRKNVETQLRLITMDPTKFTFGQSTPEELHPDVIAHFSAQSKAKNARTKQQPEYMPSTIVWLQEATEPPNNPTVPKERPRKRTRPSQVEPLPTHDDYSPSDDDIGDPSEND